MLAFLIVMLSGLVSAAAEVSKFTVYSEPVELRYGEVHNRVRFSPTTSTMPDEVVARYASGEKLMAIAGFDVDMVRRHADGTETRVLLSDHYLHHYVLYFGQAKAMQKMIKVAEQDRHAAHMITGCHAMKGSGPRQFQRHMEAHGEAGEGYEWISFGSASGAEYRHNPQRFEAPYRILMRKPEVWAPTMHIINTNLMDNRTEVAKTPPAVNRLLECPCTPQRKINVANGTIDGKAADPPIQCSAKFAATGNPSCHLSTYVGGWRCCEDGMFLIDTDKECKLPGCLEKPLDKVYMKFTFLYEDATPRARQIEGAACCDVTSDGQGDENIEYDIPTCAPGTPPDQCVHIAESVQPVAYFQKLPWSRPARSSLVDIVFAGPHLHWAGLSIELFDHSTNKKLCEVHRSAGFEGGIMYGNGSTVGNENGYLVGLKPCTWNGSTAPRFRRDHLLRTRAVYNATSYHTGVMSLWLMQVSAVPDDVVV